MSYETNLDVKNIEKSYGNIKAINGVSFKVKKGEIISIIGPSGAGKSALLRNIIQIEKPDFGHIYVDGEILFSKNKGDFKPVSIEHSDFIIRKEKIGMIFQHFNLFPHKTALENIIEAPITVKKMDKNVAIDEAKRLLDRVGLMDKKDSYPNELSGGQKQRIAIARALAMKPEILLCDEPTSALDPELIGEVLNVLKELANEKMTMIVVSHEMSFVRELSTNIAFMDGGKIIFMDSSDSFFYNQSNARIKDFLDRIFYK